MFRPFPFVDILNGYARSHFEDNCDFCLPSSLKHALNAQKSCADDSAEVQKCDEITIRTWGEILSMNNCNELGNGLSRKRTLPGHFFRDGKLPLLPKKKSPSDIFSKNKEKTTSSSANSDRLTSGNLCAHSSAGLLMSDSLSKSDLQIGSYESREEDVVSNNNSGSISFSEEGKDVPISGSLKSGSEETLQVGRSLAVGKKTSSSLLLLSQETNAIDLISIGKTKMLEHVKTKRSTEQRSHSLSEVGNGSYGVGLDINGESPDLLAPSFMKRLAVQEFQRKQSDDTNRLKSLLLSSMQKYDDEASIVSRTDTNVSSSSSSTLLAAYFQPLSRRESESDKDKHRLHSSPLSPRNIGRERLAGREVFGISHFRSIPKQDGEIVSENNQDSSPLAGSLDNSYSRSRNDSIPIRIKNSPGTKSAKKVRTSKLQNQPRQTHSNLSQNIFAGPSSPSRVSFASRSK